MRIEWLAWFCDLTNELLSQIGDLRGEKLRIGLCHAINLGDEYGVTKRF